MNSNFNLADPEFLREPQHMLADMRAVGPLVKVKFPIVGKMWVTTTHAATSQVAKGKDRFFLTGKGAGLNNKGNVAMPWWAPAALRTLASNMLGMDDPDHRRLRKRVDSAFARRGIRDMRAQIADEAAKRAEQLGHGQTDIVPGFCRRLPLEVIAELLGVPTSDRETFATFGGALGEFGGAFSAIKMIRSTAKLHKHVRNMIEGMRENPTPGLIADLLSEQDGEDTLSEEELLSMVFLLLFAGFETTTNLISGSILALENNPEQKQWLFDDLDGRIETATEELCRFVSAVGGTKPRIAAMDTKIEGTNIGRGEKIMALPVAANFDPAVFDEPEKLKLDRFPNPHLAFSTGNHFCLGMQLARVELQEALRALYAAAENLSLVGTMPDYAKRPGHRALKSLVLNL